MVRNFVQKFIILSRGFFKKYAISIVVICLCFGLTGCVGQSVFANDGSLETTFFGRFKDEGNGCGVYLVLNFVIDFLAFGVGIAATIGIVVSGIMYLTARDNEAQVIKAKRRIYEIVIGLAVYLTLWSILSFILPGGVLNNSPQCGDASEFDNTFFTNPEETSSINSNVEKWNNYGRSRRNASGDYSTSMSTGSGNMLAAAKAVAELYVKNGVTYSEDPNLASIARLKNGGGRLTSNCATYVSLVAQEAGLLKKGNIFFMKVGGVGGDVKALTKFRKINAGGSSVASLVKAGKLVPGDVIGLKSGGPHTMIYAGKKNGKYRYYNGGKAATNTKGVGGRYKKVKSFYTTYTNSCGKGSCTVSYILHPR